MTKEFNPKEALDLVEHLKNNQPVTQDMQSTMMAEEMQISADALTALLDEIERLRGLLDFALDFAVEMTGEPDCWYDHHGYCQAHNLQPKGECWVELARKGSAQ